MQSFTVVASANLSAQQQVVFVRQGYDSSGAIASRDSQASFRRTDGPQLGGGDGTSRDARFHAESEKTQFTYKDYVNGRLPPPDNWKDLQILFGAVFGHPVGRPEIDFRPSVEQSLFLSNDRLMNRWLEDSTDRLVDRLRKIEEPARLADELYLTVLSRMSTSDERAEVAEFLKSASVRRSAVVDLCRALLTSAEFRMNH